MRSLAADTDKVFSRSSWNVGDTDLDPGIFAESGAVEQGAKPAKTLRIEKVGRPRLRSRRMQSGAEVTFRASYQGKLTVFREGCYGLRRSGLCQAFRLRLFL